MKPWTKLKKFERIENGTKLKIGEKIESLKNLKVVQIENLDKNWTFNIVYGKNFHSYFDFSSWPRSLFSNKSGNKTAAAVDS